MLWPNTSTAAGTPAACSASSAHSSISGIPSRAAEADQAVDQRIRGAQPGTLEPVRSGHEQHRLPRADQVDGEARTHHMRLRRDHHDPLTQAATCSASTVSRPA
jgi:hypothetical protein